MQCVSNGLSLSVYIPLPVVDEGSYGDWGILCDGVK